VIMAANDGERKAARPSASPAFRLELAAVSSAVVGLGLALARRRTLRGGAQRVEARGVWEPVFVDEAPNCRRYCGARAARKGRRDAHGNRAQLRGEPFDHQSAVTPWLFSWA
jgi:hypothetical protein